MASIAFCMFTRPGTFFLWPEPRTNGFRVVNPCPRERHKHPQVNPDLVLDLFDLFWPQINDGFVMIGGWNSSWSFPCNWQRKSEQISSQILYNNMIYIICVSSSGIIYITRIIACNPKYGLSENSVPQIHWMIIMFPMEIAV